MDPIHPPTSRLLPIEVPDRDEVMEDMFETPTQASDRHLSPDDDSFSDNQEDIGNTILCDDPFSDDHATASTSPVPQNNPFTSTSHTFPPSAPSDEDMDMSLPPSCSENSSIQGSACGSSSLLVDEDPGFEDSGLDPASSGLPSLSEQLKERFLADYHGGGKWCQDEDNCICLPLGVDSKALI